MKKLIAMLLVVAALCTFAPASIAATSSFSDVTDSQTARDVAVLQMLEVVSGDGGKFMPDGTLTRAAFCKMAIIVMGRGGEEPLYRNRTIFPDVRADHWARGYINLAVSGEGRIMTGNSDGTFRPDDDITWAQAITILMRMLGYTDADAGMLWPTGYLDLAEQTGLTKGVSVSAHAPIQRAAAAKLFCNLLDMNVKGGTKYAAKLGAVVPNVIIMELGVTADDGSEGAIRTSKGVYTVKSGIVPEAILGQRGTLLVNEDEDILTFFPGDGKSETITAMTINAGWIKTADGKKYDIPVKAVVYTPDGETTLDKIFIDIMPGTRITLFYSSGSQAVIDAVYIDNSKSDEAVIVQADGPRPNAFTVLTGGNTGYTVVKSGIESSFSDIGKYDVATYNSSSKTLTVSDFRMTACFEDVGPNTEDPSRVTMLGREFDVLPSAAETVSKFKPGEMVTALFTADNRVAAFIAPNELRTTPVGIVNSISSASATVTLLNGMTFSGKPQATDYQVSQLGGALVTVSSSSIGGISLTKVSGNGASGGFDVNEMTIGRTTVSKNVRIFDKVGTSGVVPVALEDLASGRISQEKISYVRTGAGGKIDLVVLSDATGDVYEYGFLKMGSQVVSALGKSSEQDEEDDEDDSASSTAVLQTVSVTNKDGTFGPAVTGVQFTNGALGGLALSATGDSAAGIAELTAVTRLSRSAFKTAGGKTFVTIDGTDFPVADNVQCYNRATGTWFNSLDDIRAYSNSLTVYYDRPAAENGKIRFVTTG